MQAYKASAIRVLGSGAEWAAGRTLRMSRAAERVPRHRAEYSRGRSGFPGSTHTTCSPTKTEMWSGISISSPTRAGGWRSKGARDTRPANGLNAGSRSQPATEHGRMSLLLGVVPQCQLMRVSATADGGASANARIVNRAMMHHRSQAARRMYIQHNAACYE